VPRGGPAGAGVVAFDKDSGALLWQATNDRAHLVEAKRLLDRLVALAPPDCRAAMLSNVRCNREIVEAARANGV